MGVAIDASPAGGTVEPDIRAWKRPLPWSDNSTYVLTRTILLRALGLIYFVGFLILWNQGDGLFGSEGILPARRFLDMVQQRAGSVGYFELPTLFWITSSDSMLRGAALVGVLLSAFAVLGFSNSIVMAVLWVLYESFTHVGQIFYGYGWELLLLEAGFLSIFLVAPLSLRAFPRSPPPIAVVWLERWLLFRLMLGAGLIKIRGDSCWTELTCLSYHYETQPNPGPLSWYFDALPMWADKAGVVFNHFVELVVPFGVFGPRRLRHAAGLLVIIFQTTLILSGNLSFLNWLTIAVALSCFDDEAFLAVMPPALRSKVGLSLSRAREQAAVVSRTRRRVILGLVFGVGILSVAPVVNLIMPDQRMNASFEPLHLVNTYGAFGSVDRVRHEVVIEGTSGDALGPDELVWKEYAFHCKPGDVRRRPCLVTPYHYRLDWQMWFAGHQRGARDTWFVKLVYELLRGNRHVTALLERDPFAGSRPRFVRALLYEYEFSHDLRKAYWDRHLLGEYLRPMAIDDAALQEFLAERGF